MAKQNLMSFVYCC